MKKLNLIEWSIVDKKKIRLLELLNLAHQNNRSEKNKNKNYNWINAMKQKLSTFKPANYSSKCVKEKLKEHESISHSNWIKKKKIPKPNYLCKFFIKSLWIWQYWPESDTLIGLGLNLCSSLRSENSISYFEERRIGLAFRPFKTTSFSSGGEGWACYTIFWVKFCG